MRAFISFVVFLLACGNALAQTPTKYQIEHASGPCKLILMHQNNSLARSFHLRQGEIYRHTPAVSYSIQPDGRITNAKIIQSSGIKRLDDLVFDSVTKGKYKPRAPQCGIVDSQIAINLEWR